MSECGHSILRTGNTFDALRRVEPCLYCERAELRSRLAELEALLREARTEVEWWTPDECNATDQETSKLRYWYKVRDRIDAHLAGGA